MNTGNKGYKAAEEAVLSDVMAEEAMMSPEQKLANIKSTAGKYQETMEFNVKVRVRYDFSLWQ